MTKTLTIQVHYYLKDKDVHYMNAYTHNKCEAQILAAIKQLKSISGQDDIKVEICVPEAGGFIDKIKVISESSLSLLLITAILNHHFAPAINPNVETQSAIEAAKSLKEGNFTEEEASILVQGNERLEKFSSEYYKNLRNESDIEKVEATISGVELQANSTLKTQLSIAREEFDSRIIENFQHASDSLKTTIQIVAPVLVNARNLKWRGRYNGENISFTVKDNDFLTQVSNREVKFEAGTSLYCDIQIEEKGKRRGGKVFRSIKTYTVKKIHSWTDGNNMRTETRRLRKE